jgi:hypothetical protein
MGRGTVPSPTLTVHRPTGRWPMWMQARSTEPSATRPSHGTCRWPGRSNRDPALPAAGGSRHDQCASPGSGHPSADHRCTSAATSTGEHRQSGHDAPNRHARRDKKTAARCGPPLAARPDALVASPVVGRLPHPSRARSACLCEGARTLVTGRRTPCVHRLWMTMWTGKVGVVHHGHIERDPGAIRLSPTVILTRSTGQPAKTKRWKP